MNETDEKEIITILYSSNNVIRDIGKWIDEDRLATETKTKAAMVKCWNEVFGEVE